jgi:DNA modification methylase
LIPYYSDNSVNIYHGDALTVLRSFVDQSVQCVVTSPPYWGLRDYGVTGQLGLEKTPAEYVTRMVEVFREVRRVLRDDGTIWVNLGDSYYNCRGENNASRYDYEFNVGAKEANGAGRPNGASNTPGIKSFNGTRNIRTVWEIATQPYPEAHFATFPEDLVKPCVLAGSRPGDVVLDPFAGSGTALYVAKELGRKAIGIELKAEYIELAARRLAQEVLDFSVDRAKEGPD